MSLSTILIVILMLMPLGVILVWPHLIDWNYTPSVAMVFAMIVIVVLTLTVIVVRTFGGWL